MKCLKHIFGAMLILIYLSTSAQNFTFSYGTAPYESIVGVAQKWNQPQAGVHAFPQEFFIKEFGNVDSIQFSSSGSAVILLSSEHEGEFILLANGRNESQYFPTLGDVWYNTTELNGEEVFLMEFRVTYEGSSENFGSYQIQFFLESGNIRFHYGDPGFEIAENEEIGIGLEQQNLNPTYFMYLKGDAQQPQVATAVAEVGNLFNYPENDTYYKFTAGGLSIGDKEILAKTAVQETERGFRVLSRELDIEAQLLTLDGKTLAVGENYNSEYTFLTPKSSLQPGIYLVRITNTQSGKAATVKVYRD